MDIFKTNIIISFGRNVNRSSAVIVIFIAVCATFDHWNNILTGIKQYKEECCRRCHFDFNLRIIQLAKLRQCFHQFVNQHTVNVLHFAMYFLAPLAVVSIRQIKYIAKSTLIKV